MRSQIGSFKLNKWAFKLEFRISEKILPTHLSTYVILNILDIYLENEVQERLPRFLLFRRFFSIFGVKGNFELSFEGQPDRFAKIRNSLF